MTTAKAYGAWMKAGGLGVTPLGATQGTLKHYRRKVAANNRRLTARREGKAK